MKNFNLVLTILIIIPLASGCKYIYYQITTRVDPFLKDRIDRNHPYTFSFLNDPSNKDPVIEKQIHFIIMNGLKEKGWIYDNSGKGEIVIFVKYSLEEKTEGYVESFMKPKKNENDPYDYEHVATTRTNYARKVSIYASFQYNIKDVIWSADCESRGSRNDMMVAAKPMVKFAIERFLLEGFWKEKSVIENE